jgi:hypothetical protein
LWKLYMWHAYGSTWRSGECLSLVILFELSLKGDWMDLLRVCNLTPL